MHRRHFTFTIFALSLIAFPAWSQRNVTGAWGPVIQWPHIPVSVAHLADGRVITWASTRPTTFPAGETFTYSTIFDPRTNTFTDLPNIKHDMFCAGVASLADGPFLVSGGGARDSYDVVDVPHRRQPLLEPKWRHEPESLV